MVTFASFDELFHAVKSNPQIVVPKPLLKRLVATFNESSIEVVELISAKRVHGTLMFEELVRAKVFSLNELLTISLTSAPGAVSVIKNIKIYEDEISNPEGFTVLRSLLTPVPRASSSTGVVRSKKDVVSALCTRNGFFSYARSAGSDVRELYETLFEETFEDTAVNYVISVYAQELILSANDKRVLLPRLASSLKRVKTGTAAATLDKFIYNRFYFRMFSK